MLKAFVRQRLPLPIQDRLRAVADQVIPSRRPAQNSQDVAANAALAARVSPRGVVLAGPFRGLKIADETQWLGNVLYLSGVYEECLQPAISHAIAHQPRVVVDVGSADGYYAVGLARELPDATVYAFDIDPQAQKSCGRTAALNAVTNVRIKGRVTSESLNEVLEPGALLICDAEGFEVDLLDPDRAPRLAMVRIIVELHDALAPGATQIINERFRGTHSVEMVTEPKSGGHSWPHLAHLSASDLRDATYEGRPVGMGAMAWAILTPQPPRSAVDYATGRSE